MTAIWIVAGATAIALLGYLWVRRQSAGRPDRSERPVLPAHYSSLLQTDRSRYPGLCAACGTENTPGYNFCRECGERLPGGTHTRVETDVSKIFRE